MYCSSRHPRKMNYRDVVILLLLLLGSATPRISGVSHCMVPCFSGKLTCPCRTELNYFSWSPRRRGVAVISPKGKETIQQGGISSGAAEHRGRHQRSDDAALWYSFWPLVLFHWEEASLIFQFLISYYISPGHHKLT